MTRLITFTNFIQKLYKLYTLYTLIATIYAYLLYFFLKITYICTIFVSKTNNKPYIGIKNKNKTTLLSYLIIKMFCRRAPPGKCKKKPLPVKVRGKKIPFVPRECKSCHDNFASLTLLTLSFKVDPVKLNLRLKYVHHVLFFEVKIALVQSRCTNYKQYSQHMIKSNMHIRG